MPTDIEVRDARLQALQSRDDEIKRLHAALKCKDVLIEKLHVVAKNVSHALMSFTPGGSEYFTRVKVDDFEDYYADADVCQRRIRERITSAEERARDSFRSMPLQDHARPRIVGRVTGKIYEGDQVRGMPQAICHACGLTDYPCGNPDCPKAAMVAEDQTAGPGAEEKFLDQLATMAANATEQDLKAGIERLEKFAERVGRLPSQNQTEPK